MYYFIIAFTALAGSGPGTIGFIAVCGCIAIVTSLDVINTYT